MDIKVCVIDDGRPGHVNQTLGALRMLQMPEQAISRLSVTVRRKYLKRPILLGLALFGRLPRWLLALAYAGYYGQRPPQVAPGVLVMSTGGDTLIANIALARLHGLKNVYIGKRYRAAVRNVHLVVTSGGAPVPGKIITLPFAPVYPEMVPPLAIDRTAGTRLCAVLVGGESQEYHYAEADYRALAEALNQLCARQQMRVLITTSRRTGAAGEHALRSALQPQHIADATWYSEAPRPTSTAYCQASDVILVTEDSGTMLAEALNFGKPLIAASPSRVAITPFYADFLDRLGARGLHRRAIADIAGLDIDALAPAQPPDHRELVDGIRRLLATAAS